MPTRHHQPLVLVAGAFTLGGGFVHLREWLDGYRDVPADVPGALVVRVGFPVTAALALALAVGLVVTLWVARPWAPAMVLAAAAFNAASLGTLMATRTGSVLGWTEPVWTPGADQIRAVELGALIALAASVLVTRAAAHRVDLQPASVAAPSAPR